MAYFVYLPSTVLFFCNNIGYSGTYQQSDGLWIDFDPTSDSVFTFLEMLESSTCQKSSCCLATYYQISYH